MIADESEVFENVHGFEDSFWSRVDSLTVFDSRNFGAHPKFVSEVGECAGKIG